MINIDNIIDEDTNISEALAKYEKWTIYCEKAIAPATTFWLPSDYDHDEDSDLQDIVTSLMSSANENKHIAILCIDCDKPCLVIINKDYWAKCIGDDIWFVEDIPPHVKHVIDHYNTVNYKKQRDLCIVLTMILSIPLLVAMAALDPFESAILAPFYIGFATWWIVNYNAHITKMLPMPTNIFS